MPPSNSNDQRQSGPSMSLEDFSNANKQTIEQFKIWFNLNDSIGNEEALMGKGIQFCVDFYKKLRSCAPGTYKYPFINVQIGRRPDNTIAPMFLLATATIVGNQNGKCIVTTTRMLSSNGVQKSRCEYTAKDLAFFTDDMANNSVCRATIFPSQEEKAVLGEQNKGEWATLSEIFQRACFVVN